MLFNYILDYFIMIHLLGAHMCRFLLVYTWFYRFLNYIWVQMSSIFYIPVQPIYFHSLPSQSSAFAFEIVDKEVSRTLI